MRLFLESPLWSGLKAKAEATMGLVSISHYSKAIDSYSVPLIQIFLHFRKCVMEEKSALEEKVIPLVVENTLFL